MKRTGTMLDFLIKAKKSQLNTELNVSTCSNFEVPSSQIFVKSTNHISTELNSYTETEISASSSETLNTTYSLKINSNRNLGLYLNKTLTDNDREFFLLSK